MKYLKKYIINEYVQKNWFNNNPNFFITQGVKQYKHYKKSTIDKVRYKNDILKKIKINDIKYKIDNNRFIKRYNVISPVDINNYSFSLYDNYYSLNILIYNDMLYLYKLYISFINFLNKNELTIELTGDKYDIIKRLSNYYLILYKDSTSFLFLTKNKDNLIKKLNELKNKKTILFIKTQLNNKEFTDIEILDINKIRNDLKMISYNDITFQKDKNRYNVIIKNKKLNNKIKKYQLISYDFFVREDFSFNFDYFGHLKNRFHNNGLSSHVQGIGLGYKIYKSFIKYQGYIITNKSTSVFAKNIYYHLLRDKDIYHVIDNINDRLLLIWKNYPKIKLIKLIRIIHKYEKLNNYKYNYDKRLNNFIND